MNNTSSLTGSSKKQKKWPTHVTVQLAKIEQLCAITIKSPIANYSPELIFQDNS